MCWFATIREFRGGRSRYDYDNYDYGYSSRPVVSSRYSVRPSYYSSNRVARLPGMRFYDSTPDRYYLTGGGYNSRYYDGSRRTGMIDNYSAFDPLSRTVRKTIEYR